MHTPKRRKLRTTSRYIFETLFLEGKDSDVTLNALSREWKLHKVRLAIEYVINDMCYQMVAVISILSLYLISFDRSYICSNRHIFAQCFLDHGKNLPWKKLTYI